MVSSRPNYVIGDVHGRADLLEAIVAFAHSDAAKRGRSPKFTFLGDIVDRGPRSREAMDIVCGLLRESPDNTLLCGNHDYWFHRAVVEGYFAEIPVWLNQGGLETLASYGQDDLATAGRAISRDFGAHVESIGQAPLVIEDDNFAYAHAGIDPLRSINEVEDPSLFMWVRAPFLNFVGTLTKPVIHGHTICKDGLPIVTENRISIDTGAYRTGRLTVAVLDPVEKDISFHQTDGNAHSVVPIRPIRQNRGLGTVLDDAAALFDRKALENSGAR